MPYTHTTKSDGQTLTAAEWNAVGDAVESGTVSVTEVLVAASNAPAKTIAGADYGCDGTDDHVQIQAAIDAAQADVDAHGGAIELKLIGDFKTADTIEWKSCPLVGSQTKHGTSLRWDGAAGGLMMTKNHTLEGGMSLNHMREIQFRSGTAEPLNFLEFPHSTDSGKYVDAELQLQRVKFFGSSGSGIKVGRWVNLHWEHLRWDNVGGYAIELKAGQFDNQADFCIDGFSYDHSRTSSRGLGFLNIDLTTHPSNAGTVTLKNARVEVNKAWEGNQAFVNLYHGADSTASARSVQLHIEDITFQDVGNGEAKMTDDCIIYRDTANTTQSESFYIENCVWTSDSAVLGGTWPTTQVIPAMPPAGLIQLMVNGSVLRLLDGVSVKVVAGAVSDGSFAPTTVPDGTVAIDSTNGRFYFKYGGAWHYVTQTA